MSTFLELCQSVATEVGVAGADGDLPTSVVGQTGELRRIVRWVQAAWREIEGNRFYDWMWELAHITIPANVNYAADEVPVVRYIPDTAFKPTTSTDGRWLEFIPWDDWRGTFDDTYIALTTQVTAWTVRPDNAIVVNGTPTTDSGGPVDFYVERYANPVELTDDTDVPGMPLDLHDLIVYKAIVRYANNDEAGTMRQTAIAEVARLERDLNKRCLPVLRMGGTLLDNN